MFDLPSILPPNHTAVEAALEQAIRKGKPDLTPIAKLMNPDTCPDDLLGWLAWTFSVDVWDANWSEMIKREVIRRSIAIHRIKGTVGSVRRALATVSFRSDISEWFEHSGDPHTFRIDVLVEKVLEAGLSVSPELAAEVGRVIDQVKPVRSHYDLRLGDRLNVTSHVRTGYRQYGKDVTPRGATPPTFTINASARAGTGYHQYGKDVTPRGATPPTFTINASARAGTGLREHAFDRATFTPIQRSAA